MPGRLIALSLLCMCAESSTGQTLVRCGDVSFLDELEDAGAAYLAGGVESDALAILKERGLDTVRILLFHSPEELRDGQQDVVALAERAVDLELGIVLAVHYSDTWADPGQQTRPGAWDLLSNEVPGDSVEVGNEITSGFLWNDGRVGGAFETPALSERFAGLLRRAVERVRRAVGDDSAVMVHVNPDGDPDGAPWFFDNLMAWQVDFDVIGVSYHPWWHGTLDEFEATVRMLRGRYDMPVFLAETAYPWTLEWFDDTHNVVGLPEHLLPGYEDTPEGQAAFVSDIAEILEDIEAAGLCCGSPDYVTTPEMGSPWENVALFDNVGEVLPAAEALGGTLATRRRREDRTVSKAAAIPNPARDAVRIEFADDAEDCVLVTLYDALGRLRRTEQNEVRHWPGSAACKGSCGGCVPVFRHGRAQRRPCARFRRRGALTAPGRIAKRLPRIGLSCSDFVRSAHSE